MSQLVAILPDQQIPHQDRALHKLVLEWLAYNQPEKIVLSGDLLDNRALTRHGWNPKTDPNPLSSLQSDLSETGEYLDSIMDAARPDECWLIEGNHEQHLQRYVLRNAQHLACLEDLQLTRLLRLEDRGIRYVGDWPAGKLWLTPKLAVIHGRYARKYSGQTALVTLQALGHSVIMGHTHRMGMVFRTTHSYYGPDTHVAVEAGTLARLEGGLGYAPDPDWQNGFVVVRLNEDGGFHCSPATYVKGRLRWEDQEYGD